MKPEPENPRGASLSVVIQCGLCAPMLLPSLPRHLLTKEAIMSQEVNFKASGSEVSPSEPAADELLVKAALDYHRFPTPGKITVLPTKDMTTQRDLALA